MALDIDVMGLARERMDLEKEKVPLIPNSLFLIPVLVLRAGRVTLFGMDLRKETAWVLSKSTYPKTTDGSSINRGIRKSNLLYLITR